MLCVKHRTGSYFGKQDRKGPHSPKFTFLRVGGGRQNKINKKILDTDIYHKENKEYCVRE